MWEFVVNFCFFFKGRSGLEGGDGGLLQDALPKDVPGEEIVISSIERKFYLCGTERHK